MAEDVFSEIDARMRKAVEVLGRDLASIRTGRASPGLVEHLRVDYYGVPTPLNQIAGVSVPEARLLAIQPWDKKALPSIEKAILKSDLGLTPTNDGNLIRLAIPTLTEERRRELVKVVRRKVEEGRVALRNIRRDGLEQLREMEKEKVLSEDALKRTQEQLQRITDSFIEEMNWIGQGKEKELLEA